METIDLDHDHVIMSGPYCCRYESELFCGADHVTITNNELPLASDQFKNFSPKSQAKYDEEISFHAGGSSSRSKLDGKDSTEVLCRASRE